MVHKCPINEPTKRHLLPKIGGVGFTGRRWKYSEKWINPCGAGLTAVCKLFCSEVEIWVCVTKHAFRAYFYFAQKRACFRA